MKLGGKGIVYGALILTLANIITKLIGFVYRIYMSNVIGAEGMGLYQLIVPIYMLCWSISSSGFSTAVSKLTAQENAKKQYGNIGRLIKQAIFITAGVSIIIGLILYFKSDYIAAEIIKDKRTSIDFKILSICIPFMAAGSCIRGFFHGIQENTVPAISQVFEQTVRMVVVYFLSSTLIPMGIEYACAAAIIGISVGEILSFVLVFISYKYFKKKNDFTRKPVWSSIKTASLLLGAAIPLTANRIVGSLLITTENILIPQKLQEFGNNASQAMSEYGQLTGMAMPLVQFPSSLLLALSISLVPVVSEATALRNKSRIVDTLAKSFLFTTVVGIGASAIFFIFSNEVGAAIFKQEQVGEFLLKMSVLCPFMYMQIVMSGMLNGLGEQMFIFKMNLFSSIFNIITTVIFVPIYGIDAYLLSWFISILFTCYFSTRKVCDSVSLRFQIRKWIYKPILSSVAAGLTTRYIAVKYLFNSLHVDLFSVLLVISIMMGMYVMFLFVLGGISKEDISMITKRIKIRSA